jgi:hypothetical protein
VLEFECSMQIITLASGAAVDAEGIARSFRGRDQGPSLGQVTGSTVVPL